MMEIGLMIAVFLAGVLAGVIGLGQWEMMKLEKEKATKRKKASEKAVSTRRKKSVEKLVSVPQVDPAEEKVDAALYGRKANGEGTWPR